MELSFLFPFLVPEATEKSDSLEEKAEFGLGWRRKSCHSFKHDTGSLLFRVSSMMPARECQSSLTRILSSSGDYTQIYSIRVERDIMLDPYIITALVRI